MSVRLHPDQLDATGLTHKGVLRDSNQDALGETGPDASRPRAFVVADGMGGHAGGETASRLAVERTLGVFASAKGGADERLHAAITAANEVVYGTQLRDTRLSGMGTTGVAIAFDAEGAFVANVGDSRAYRLRDGTLEQLTRDHSVVAELERRGFITAAEARVHPRRNEVLRSLGTEATVEVDLDPVDVAVGDRFLLCSDGLNGVVEDDHIAELLARDPVDAAARALVQAANDRGGPDNVTVQIVRVPPEACEEAKA